MTDCGLCHHPFAAHSPLLLQFPGQLLFSADDDCASQIIIREFVALKVGIRSRIYSRRVRIRDRLRFNNALLSKDPLQQKKLRGVQIERSKRRRYRAYRAAASRPSSPKMPHASFGVVPFALSELAAKRTQIFLSSSPRFSATAAFSGCRPSLIGSLELRQQQQQQQQRQQCRSLLSSVNPPFESAVPFYTASFFGASREMHSCETKTEWIRSVSFFVSLFLCFFVSLFTYLLIGVLRFSEKGKKKTIRRKHSFASCLFFRGLSNL